MPPNPGEMRNLRCYVLRYPDLLSGFCQGSLELCNWAQIASHFDKAGSVEGRCALHHRTAPVTGHWRSRAHRAPLTHCH